MKITLLSLLFLFCSFQGITQDSLQIGKTKPLTTYYTEGRNINFDVFFTSDNKEFGHEKAMGYGFQTFLAYQFENTNIGIGTGLESHYTWNYIPVFLTIRQTFGQDNTRFFLYFDYGYLSGKPFNNEYEDGSYCNAGAGIKYFVRNYKTLNFSVGVTNRQLNKPKAPRDTNIDLLMLFKLGYSIY